MDKNIDHAELSESIQILRNKLKEMKYEISNEESKRNRRKASANKGSIIDGNFLSMVFVVVLLLILTVTFYAFFNLFNAVKKKYIGSHSEL